MVPFAKRRKKLFDLMGNEHDASIFVLYIELDFGTFQYGSVVPWHFDFTFKV